MRTRIFSATLFLVTLCAAVVLTTPTTTQAQVPFFLTSEQSPGHIDVRSICMGAKGFHMASIYEFLYLKIVYANKAAGPDGYRRGPDQVGLNVPIGVQGWIQTGEPNNPTTNCNGWTSNSTDQTGAALAFVYTPPLTSESAAEGVVIGPNISLVPCQTQLPVWCIQ